MLVDLSNWFELAPSSLDQLAHVVLDYLLYPFITLLMCLLSVFVVLGNLLVVTAIWHENQLHSVTNYLIASLAAADCLVGALVMPFSIISEMIIGSWTFGPTLCDLWHSFDVLASTASIMNLCAISLDRYLAITNPICYPTKMTPKRVALLIVSLWTCSSLISFPAILWWRAVGDGDGPLQQVSISAKNNNNNNTNANANGNANANHDNNNNNNRQLMIKNVISNTLNNNELEMSRQQQNSSSLQVNLQKRFDLIQANELGEQPPALLPNGDIQDEQVRFKCPFTDDTYYLLFSSFVSFYGPLCVMLYAYICIYRAAVQQTRFLKYGSKQVTMSGAGGSGGGGGGGSTGSGSHGHSNKRSKRHKHANQLAQAGHLAGANCDHYEQQHLVLRAHRGGGGGGGSASAAKLNETPSAASKRAKSQQRLKQQQQQQIKQQQLQTSPTDEDGDDEDEDESEPYKLRNAHLTSSSLDRSSTLSDSFNGSATRNSPPDSTINLDQAQHQNQNGKSQIARIGSSSRSQRIGLAQSQRDKMRVESQRFDPPTSLSNSNTTANKSQEMSRAKCPPSPGLSEASSKLPSGAAHRSLCDSSSSSSSSCDATTMQADNKGADRQVDLTHHFRFANALRSGGGVGGGPNSSMGPPLPASLVPLIMMNSDTSTDSSIVTVVTRPACARNPEAKQQAIVDQPKQVGAQAGAGSVKGPVVGVGKGNHQVTINLNFDERTTTTTTMSHQAQGANVTPIARGNSIGKGQILHYNSDKLIQSIVDLSNIHYIDCTANSTGTRNNSDTNQAFELNGTAAAVMNRGQNHIHQAASQSNHQLEPIDGNASDANDKSGPLSQKVVVGGGGVKQSSKSRTSAKQQEQQVAVGVPARQQKSMGKKLTKLAKERKAAKTLGIVVGVFILCWLPFFVVNILVALCGLNCIYKPELLFSVVTWLGWLNSAMNPVIYACWSRDFRRAFRRVLCTWVEFLCYDGTRLARKLKLKKNSAYSNRAAQQSGTSIEINITPSGAGSKGAVLRTNSSSNSHKVLLADQ